MEHKLLEKYRLFIKTLDANPFDFIIEEKQIDFPLIGQSFIKDFKTIGTTKAGCIIGEYENRETQKKYIVWLDSEGEPNFPVAESIHDLFSILPWGTGFIYDVAFRSLSNAEDRTETADDTLFVNDYEKTVGIKRHKQPEKVIRNAIKKNKTDLDNMIYK